MAEGQQIIKYGKRLASPHPPPWTTQKASTDDLLSVNHAAENFSGLRIRLVANQTRDFRLPGTLLMAVQNPKDADFLNRINTTTRGQQFS